MPKRAGWFKKGASNPNASKACFTCFFVLCICSSSGGAPGAPGGPLLLGLPARETVGATSAPASPRKPAAAPTAGPSSPIARAAIKKGGGSPSLAPDSKRPRADALRVFGGGGGSPAAARGAREGAPAASPRKLLLAGAGAALREGVQPRPFSMSAFFNPARRPAAQAPASPAKEITAPPAASPAKALAPPPRGAPASPQRAPPLRPLAALVAEGSALCAQLAGGAVIVLPRVGEAAAPVLAPLALARGASRTLLMAAPPPSAPTVDCTAFAAAALQCAVPFFTAAPFLSHGTPLLALFTAACGASLREGVAIVGVDSGGYMVVRFPRSLPVRLRGRGACAEVSVQRRLVIPCYPSVQKVPR
jgi:hypothetical protein